MSDVRELFDHLCSAVEMVGAAFTEPDDDWIPVAHLMAKDGSVLIVGLSGDFLASEAGKDRLVRNLRELIAEHHAKAIGLTFSAWTLNVPRTTHPEMVYGPGLPRPSTHPDREECVAVSVIGAEESIFGSAPIKRDDSKPPTLGGWQEAESAMGRFSEPLRNAIKIEGRTHHE